MFELVVLMKKQTTIDDLQFMQHALKILKHHEADDERLYLAESFILRFNRISLMDLNSKAPSVYSNEEGCHLIICGDVYNHLKLRQQLEKLGFECQHSSIGEVILTLYQLIGQEFITQLKGLFSLILYDQTSNQLFVVGDSFGIHPFYYSVFDEGIFLSSQLHPFQFHSQADKDFCSPLITLKTMKRLEPRTLLMYSFKQGLNIQSFATVELLPMKRRSDDLKTELRQAFLTSVESSLKTSDEVGCLLTESLSSVTVATCAKTFNPHLKAYTLYFKEKDSKNHPSLLQLADQFNLDLRIKSITATEFLNEAKLAMHFLGLPITNSSAIAIYHLAKEAKKETNVLLSGEGVDELLGKYPFNSLNRMDASSSFLQMLLNKVASFLSPIFKNIEKDELLSLKKYLPFKLSLDHQPIIQPATYFEKYVTPFDQLKMAQALNLHVPFLNPLVLELTKSISDEPSFKTKPIHLVLREAFVDVVPVQLLNSYKPQPFIPLKNWLKDELFDDARKILLAESCQPFIDQSKALSYLESHAKGKRDYSQELWPLLMYALWYDSWVNEKSII